MNARLFSEPSIVSRLVAAAVLAGAALTLFLLQQQHEVHPSPPPPRTADEISATVAMIDAEIDTLLNAFGIEKRWIRKRTIPSESATPPVVERRVVIPADIIPVRINAGLSGVARRHHARAFAGEDTRSRTVTIQIELDGIIYQRVILKTVLDLRRKANSGRVIGTRAGSEEISINCSLTNFNRHQYGKESNS